METPQFQEIEKTKSEPKYILYSFIIVALVLMLFIGFLFGKKSQSEIDNNLQTEVNSQPSVAPPKESESTFNTDFVSNVYEQISEAPIDLKLQKNFTCYPEYELPNLELSAFETKIFEQDFLNTGKELGIFCRSQGKVIVSYSDADGAGLIFYKPFAGVAGEEIIEQYLLQDAVGTASIKDSKLISWDDHRLLFAAHDSNIFGGLRDQTMLVYLLDIDSLDFADPDLKIIEICQFGVSPGSSLRSYDHCITPQSKKASAYVSVDDLW